ncbi:hypothetical protein CRUP_032361, partial [Coryphaenoides rupestris]
SSPPGKPTLTSCLSRDKETFTCCSEAVYQCPDYRTAGENSCYFNKNNTSIWVNYNITVVATNALGSSFSEPVVVDVAYIVQPHTPENVTVSALEDKEGTFFRVSWEPPRKADTRSGWITLVYELRAKLDGAKWEEHYAGQQKMFNIFSPRSGGTYLIQNGRLDEVFDALAVLSLPARTHCDYEDLLVYLEVSGHEEQELMLADEPAAPQGPKPHDAPSNSDSGHSSCDSHTLLMEKCGNGEDMEEEEEEEEEDRHMSEGRVKTWPMIFCPPEGYNGFEALDHRGAPGAVEQLHDSNCCFPLPSPSSTNSTFSDHQAGLVHSTCEKPQQASLHAQGQFSWQLCSHSEFHSMEPEHQHRQGGGTVKSTTTQPCPTPFQATQYVEVQKVIRENVTVLRPIPSAQGQREACLPQAGEEDYSRVKGLNSGNVLLLHRAADAGTAQEHEGREEEEEDQGDMKERKILSREGCCKATPGVPSQPSACLPTAVSLQGDMFLSAN